MYQLAVRRALKSLHPLRHLALLLVTCLGGLTLLLFFGLILQPGAGNNVPGELTDPELVEQHSNLRNPVIDRENPVDFWRDVDYSEGEAARWWPRGESPLLRQLVEQGDLPPVAERVGPEPVVYSSFEAPGAYGGDWWNMASDIDGLRLFMQYVANNNTLVRYSPYGRPVRPHLARMVEHNEDFTTWTVHLRRGVRWSDGQPFTADDIMFWWDEIANDPETGWIPETMRVAGQPGSIEKVDDYTLRYHFPVENPGFLEAQASAAGALYMAGPAHYLRQFHHRLGDRETIETQARLLGVPEEKVLHARNQVLNPELPSLSPWLLRTHRNNGPWTLVRNPYYFAVDPEGNQLPYMDRVVFRQVNQKLRPKTIADGSVSAILATDVDYATLMNQREGAGFDVRNWYVAQSGVTITPNRQLPVTLQDPTSAERRELLRNNEFRRALSIAIDRQLIIDSEYQGVGIPANPGPPPGSVGYDVEHLRANAEYDPARANEILDSLGLTQRDDEGFRMLPDGRRLWFRLIAVKAEPLLSVREDWARVGIRVVIQQKPHRLMMMETPRADFSAAGTGASLGWGALGAGAPYMNWYFRGGLHDTEQALSLPVQPDPLERTLMAAGHRMSVTPDPDEERALMQEIMQQAREQVWLLGIVAHAIVGESAQFVVKNGLRGVPELIYSDFNHGTPNNAGPETWWWEDPDTVNGRAASPQYLEDRATSIVDEIMTIRPSLQQAAILSQDAPQTLRLAWLIQYLLLGVAALLLVMVILRHPFVLRRVALMVPTIVVISIIVYVGIQAPPGSYLDTRLLNLQEQGLSAIADREAAELREKFHLDENPVKNYLRWAGVLWFFTFDGSDRGLLQGHMGLSMVDGSRVNDLVGDRVILTFVLSLGTILFTWAMAIPIGVYSAVRQYSKTDYFLTIVGFLGMCIPNFIFALVLMLLSAQLFDVTITGLFSAQYAMQDYWSWGKFVDLLKHLWIPVLVIGTAGTAGMIRVMRANLLDELKKPYVVTARAKGLYPLKILFKYPFRLAILPFIAGIGGILPELISGGAIVSIILSLPTVGPLLLDAVMLEDTYMAGSLLLILSALSVVGVLLSDLLLMLLDPRIRMEGGAR